MENVCRLTDPDSLKEAHGLLQRKGSCILTFCARCTRWDVLFAHGAVMRGHTIPSTRTGWFIGVMSRGLYWFDPPVHPGYFSAKLNLPQDPDGELLTHFVNVVTASNLINAHRQWEKIMLSGDYAALE